MALHKHPNNFGPPVLVAIGNAGHPVVVRSPPQALKLLRVQWPTLDGTMYRHARHSCYLAIAGSIASRTARNAFARAAREAGVLVEKQRSLRSVGVGHRQRHIDTARSKAPESKDCHEVRRDIRLGSAQGLSALPSLGGSQLGRNSV